MSKKVDISTMYTKEKKIKITAERAITHGKKKKKT